MALSDETIQTIIILYVSTGLAVLLMALRLVMRRVRGQKWDISDYCTMVCIVCLLARLSLIHVVLIWGSNNLTKAYRKDHIFSQTEIYKREVGSKLTLVNRTFYNTYIWLQKCVVMFLYRRLLFGLPWTDMVMNIYWAILAATYIVIQVATFTDCSPLHLYWQVVPDPGTCSQALGQLIILGALNIFTDIILIFLPMPTLLKIRRSSFEKLRILGLFSLGFFLVAITVIRLPLNFSHGTVQVNRTMWASIEAFTAAFVANVPTLYTLRRRAPDFNTNAGSRNTAGSRKEGSEEGWRKVGSRSGNGHDAGGLTVDNAFDGKKGITVTRSVEFEERRGEDGLEGLGEEGKNISWDERARMMQAMSSSSTAQVQNPNVAWNESRRDSSEIALVRMPSRP